MSLLALAWGATPVAIVAEGKPRRGVVSVNGPRELLRSRGARLAVVAAAAAKPAGGSNDNEDIKAVMPAYRFQMQLFNMLHRPVAFLAGEPTGLLESASATAQDGTRLLECLLGNEAVALHQFKELVFVGRAFIVVDGQCKEGYLRADATINAIQGLKVIDKIFFSDAILSGYTLPEEVPLLSGEDLDNKKKYFMDLVDLFVDCCTMLYWEANKKYGFDKRD